MQQNVNLKQVKDKDLALTASLIYFIVFIYQ